MKTKYAFLLLSFIISSCEIFAQPIDRYKLDSLLNLLADKNKAMGSLAVLEDGKITYANAVGFIQNEPQQVASNDKTKYRIGSISKMFTATLIFQLIEDGRIQLTTTLDQFFKDVPNANKITMAHMLSHRSGIPNFTSDPEYLKWMNTPRTRKEMLNVLFNGKPDFEPGAQTEYSNSNYVLLGYILEDIYLKPYNAILQSRICSRIGLQDTYYGGKTSVSQNESFSYKYENGWKLLPETDMSIPHGAGALVSTPSDLVKFISALFNGKLIGEESLDHMKTIIENNLGMGMMTFPYNDMTVYGHGGAIDGFNSLLVYFPEHKMAVSYISNGTVYSINDIVLRTINTYFHKPEKLPEFTVYDLKPEDMDVYTGTYSSPAIPIKLTIKKENGMLFGQGSGQPAFPLESTAKDVFKYEPAGITITFALPERTFILEQGGGKFNFTPDK